MIFNQSINRAVKTQAQAFIHQPWSVICPPVSVATVADSIEQFDRQRVRTLFDRALPREAYGRLVGLAC